MQTGFQSFSPLINRIIRHAVLKFSPCLNKPLPPLVRIHCSVSDPTAVDNKVQRLVACVEEISQWMSANRLKLNKDKTQFIWLGSPYQLSNLRCQSVTLAGVNIQISTEATCLGVLIDSALTFAPHVRRLSSVSFYHLRQMKVVRRSLTVEAAKVLVHAFVSSRIDYCNSVINRAPFLLSYSVFDFDFFIIFRCWAVR